MTLKKIRSLLIPALLIACATISNGSELEKNQKELAAVNPLLRLVNISGRANAGTGENVLIGGFIITGSQPKPVIVRAIGPSLSNRGIASAMQDPTLQLVPTNGPAIFNDDWKSDAANVQSTGLAPEDDREAAIVQNLPPGPYTAIVRGKNNGTGIALVEIYDLRPDSTTFLGNISSRGSVGIDDKVLIGGIIVQGELAARDMQVVVRGRGPSLSSSGVIGALQDPELSLVNADGVVMAANDNWQDTQETEINNSGLAPTDIRESAIVVALPRGSYTAILRGKNGSTGIALVEFYDGQI